MREYKRKFLVPGDTPQTEKDFRKKHCKVLEEAPCAIFRYTFSGRKFLYGLDESKCPYPIGKPHEYIVSETVEGEWQCDCRAWTTSKPRHDCKHIQKAKASPKKYEVSVDWTGKTIETMKKVTS